MFECAIVYTRYTANCWQQNRAVLYIDLVKTCEEARPHHHNKYTFRTHMPQTTTLKRYGSVPCSAGPGARCKLVPSWGILLGLLFVHAVVAAAAPPPPANVPWFSLRAREAALHDSSLAMPAGLADDLHTLVDLARQCCRDCFDHHVLNRYDCKSPTDRQETPRFTGLRHGFTISQPHNTNCRTVCMQPGRRSPLVSRLGFSTRHASRLHHCTQACGCGIHCNLAGAYL